MITDENKENLISQYQKLKELVFDNYLTPEEFTNHIKTNTPLGKQMRELLVSIGGEDDFTTTLNEFIKITFFSQD